MTRPTHATNARQSRRYLAALGLLAVLAAGKPATAQRDVTDVSDWGSAAKPELNVADRAITLSWGDEQLSAGLPEVRRIVLEERSVNPENDRWQREYPEPSLDGAKTRVDQANGRVVRAYGWGEMRVTYKLDGHVLRARVELENTGKKPIANFRVHLMDMRVPGKPGKLNPKRGNAVEATTDKLTTITLDLPPGRLYASYESFAPPVRFGFANAREDDPDVYPVVVGGGVHVHPEDDVVLPPAGIPTIPPGETLKLRFSFRFADKQAQRQDVLRQLYRDYREFQSPMLEWADRRPIGDAYLLAENAEGAKFGQESLNPRRWPMLEVVDSDSPSGRSLVRKWLQNLAYRTVRVLKKMDAQGGILWNVEGNFHQTGWTGDPRMLPVLSPELDKAIDDYFKILRDAGLRTGVTIRHNQVVWRGNKWTQNVGNFNPENNATLDPFHKFLEAHPHEPWWRVYPIARRMSNKIEYAKKRWGCTIFYVDTPYVHARRGVKQNWSTRKIANHIYRKIREDHPDVLIIPEGENMANLGHLAPYGEFGYGHVRAKYAGHWSRDVYPDYFGFHRVSDGAVWQTRTERVHEVAWGMVLGMSAWSWVEQTEAVVDIYAEANDKQRRATAMAKRFGLIDRPEDALALSYAIRDAMPLSTNDLVANPPASSQMRAYAQLSDDRTEALVMIAHLGYPHAPGVTLRPDLPGLGLKGEQLKVWDVESGDLISGPDAIEVAADPVAGFRMLYVKAADETPRTRPDGLRLAASFDRGELAPDQGGRLIDDHGSAPIDGKALQLQPGAGAAEYGTVPNWYGGTLEFDLRVHHADDQPMPIARLDRFMNTTLELVKHHGKPALRLRTHERGLQSIGRNDTASLGGDLETGYRPLEAVAPLPTDDGWRHVVLAWEMGQYRLYVDGERLAMIAEPASVRWRDGSIFKPGLIFGGGERGAAHAEVDSVMLYDWCVDEKLATARKGRVGVAALKRPEDGGASVWLWGDDVEKSDRAMVSVRGAPSGDRTVRMNVTLFEKLDAGLRKLAGQGEMAHHGTAVFRLDLEPEAPPAGEMDIEERQQADEDGVLGGIEDIMGPTRTFVLRVKASIPGADDVQRDIEFQYEGDKRVRFW